MARYINLDSAGKNRSNMVRGVAIALKELVQQPKVDAKTRDIVAFIALALLEISKTIDPTVEPWEKRGYWIKADRFRLEWSWAEKMGSRLKSFLNEEDWPEIAMITAQLAEKLSHVKIPSKHRFGTPWDGAWEQIKNQNNHN
ncbi:MAG: hypothetical protein JSV61_02365 [Anaerolineales bacterium]|nr:MAG: hypothetical protein JSV61_02365 [Anaerolineales bacterium]